MVIVVLKFINVFDFVKFAKDKTNSFLLNVTFQKSSKMKNFE